MTSGSPTTRRIAWASAIALGLGLTAITLLWGYSPTGWIEFLQLLAVIGTVALGFLGVMFLVYSRMADYRAPTSEAEFEALVQESERLARDGVEPEPDEMDFLVDPYEPLDFDDIVREALDDLPRDFQLVLKHVPVVVSDKGRSRGAYGLYQGDTVARDNTHDRIVIFRDTLLRDFGSNPDMLRAQVTRTVLHELAHHLGWDEPGVRGLGL